MRALASWATLDLSGPYRSVFDAMVPGATQVADPFHVVKLANAKLDECRRRVQNETLGHRGRKADPLYRIRRLLTKADERLEEHGREKLLGLLRAGDPRGEVPPPGMPRKRSASSTRTLTSHRPRVDRATRRRHGRPRQPARGAFAWPNARPLEAPDRRLARSHVSNGPTEAANNLIKRVKRAAFGFTSFRNFRVRALLYAGKPSWNLLETITPR